MIAKGAAGRTGAATRLTVGKTAAFDAVSGMVRRCGQSKRTGRHLAGETRWRRRDLGRFSADKSRPFGTDRAGDALIDTTLGRASLRTTRWRLVRRDWCLTERRLPWEVCTQGPGPPRARCCPGTQRQAQGTLLKHCARRHAGSDTAGRDR